MADHLAYIYGTEQDKNLGFRTVRSLRGFLGRKDLCPLLHLLSVLKNLQIKPLQKVNR